MDSRLKIKKGFLPLGKLPLEHLEELLKRYHVPGERVIIGAGIGQDAAVIDWGEKYLVAKTDPITFVTDEIGFYAVTINANDIACTGGLPKWFLATLLLPEGQSNDQMVESIFQQIANVCRDMNIGWVGGHTEITYGIDRPIVIGQMLGEVERDKLVRPTHVQIGDLVLLTKGIAIEAVSIIARERTEEVEQKFGTDFVKRAQNFLHDPGISVLKEAQIAVQVLASQASRVHAFHDPTEGGLAMGFYELARASLVGLEILPERIPILPEARALCDYFHLDPMGVIASGALIIVVAPVDADVIVQSLRNAGIAAEIVGEVTPPGSGVMFRKGDQVWPMPNFERDELTKLFVS